MDLKKQIPCPYNCPHGKVMKGKHFKGDLVQHFWGYHKMDVIVAHSAAEHFIATGKPLPVEESAPA